MLNKLSLNLGFYMNKKSKLGLCFIVGIVLISAMAYLLFGVQESGKSLGSLLICGACFLALLAYINKIKNL